MKALDNFDVTQNVRFSTYAVPMIIGEIRRYLRDNSAIRVSRSLRDTAYRVLQTREQLMREHQKEPSMEEIAKKLELPVEEVNFAMDAIASPVSLYDPIYSDGGDPLTVMDQVKDTRNTDERWIEHIALREAVARLPERERRIVSLRFGLGGRPEKTQKEVADLLGISQSYISRLEKRIMQRLRRDLLRQVS